MDGQIAVDTTVIPAIPSAGVKRKREEDPSDGNDSKRAVPSTVAAQTITASKEDFDEDYDDYDYEEGDAAATGNIDVAGGDGSAPRRGRRGRKRRVLDFLGDYKPGFALRHPDIFNMALKIANELNAQFADSVQQKRLREMEAAFTGLCARLREAEAELQRNPHDLNVQAQVLMLKQTHEQQEAVLDKARLEFRDSVRRNIRDKVERVTLHKDASDLKERTAAATGNEAAMVQVPTFTCANCGNTDETQFLSDNKAGDTTCKRCGAVALEHTVYDGDWTRHFEGEEDTSTIGPAPNPFVSARYNLRTSLATAPGVSSAQLRHLRLMQHYNEMNEGGATDVSEHRTREGYKDLHKLKAFDRLDLAGERLCLSEATITKAKAIFSAFRDNREHVQGFDQAVAAAMIAAVEETEYQRRQTDMMQQASKMNDSPKEDSAQNGTTAPSKAEKDPQMAPLVAGGTSMRPPPPKQDAAGLKRDALRRKQSTKKSRALGYVGEHFMTLDGDEEAEEDGTKRVDVVAPLDWIGNAEHLTIEQQNEWLKTLEGSESLNPDAEGREEYRAPS